MKLCVVGPTYPFRGGIAHYTTMLVHHLREAQHEVCFYSYVRQYPRWLFPGKTDRDPSLTPFKIDCEYVLDPINPISWWRLCHKVAREKPDVLVLQWWVPYWTPSLRMISRWIKKNTSIPIVYICHNVMPHEGGGFLDRRMAMTVLRQGDVFVVHSEQDRHRLQALLPQAQVIKTYLPSYAELADRSHVTNSELREQLAIPSDRQLMLFFGFVRPYKGLEYAIQALALARKELNLHLLVVGEFWSTPAFYERYADEFGVRDAVTFVNRYVPNEELKPYFDAADCVVLPYVSATQSAVVQLAFGFGKPVITTRVGGLHEVVHHNINGLVVPPQDEVSLADAMVRFYKEQLGPQLAANVRQEREQQLFSWQTLVEQLEQIDAQVKRR